MTTDKERVSDYLQTLVLSGAIDCISINIEQMSEQIASMQNKPNLLSESVSKNNWDFGSLFRTIIANDVLIRNMRHRDARWHDDPDVQKVLEANTAIIKAGSAKPVSISLKKCALALQDLPLGTERTYKNKAKAVLDSANEQGAGIAYVD